MGNRFTAIPAEADDLDRQWLEGCTAIPDGSFIEGMVAVVGYVTPDGEHKWMLYLQCDLPTSAVVGLLEMAKLEAISRSPGTVSPNRDPDD